jgi:hypothetical protein
MSDFGRNAKLLAWKAGNRLLRTPAAPALRAVFGSRARRSAAWAGFVPTAADAGPLTVRVDPDNSERAIEEAVGLLREHGVVRLEGLVDPAEAAAAGRALAAFLEPFAEARDRAPHGTLLGCDWQTGTGRIPDYLTRPAPVVSFLGDGPAGIDAGMIVLSRVEAVAAREGFGDLEALLASPGFRLAERIVSRLQSTGRKIHQFILSRSARAPRALHADTLGEFFNMFTYLGDVRSTDDGPFSYVPGSHLRRDLLTRGAFLHEVGGRHPKEYPELSDRAVPMLGPAGTVVIANQRGVHGAHPQREGGRRAMLIVNFMSMLQRNIPS